MSEIGERGVPRFGTIPALLALCVIIWAPGGCAGPPPPTEALSYTCAAHLAEATTTPGDGWKAAYDGRAKTIHVEFIHRQPGGQNSRYAGKCRISRSDCVADWCLSFPVELQGREIQLIVDKRYDPATRTWPDMRSLALRSPDGPLAGEFQGSWLEPSAFELGRLARRGVRGCGLVYIKRDGVTGRTLRYCQDGPGNWTAYIDDRKLPYLPGAIVPPS